MISPFFTEHITFGMLILAVNLNLNRFMNALGICHFGVGFVASA